MTEMQSNSPQAAGQASMAAKAETSADSTATGKLFFLIGALQFVYLLDFLMLMPLGPDVAQALHFDLPKLSWLSAAYTGAAILAGLFSIRYLDRLPRKKTLLVLLALLLLSTLAAGFCQNLPSLLLARSFTGLVGAPALALGMAMVIEASAPAQRGKAIANVMLGFALAVIGGVPLALEVSRFGNWQSPFYLLSVLMGVLLLLMWRYLPSLQAQTAAQPTAGKSALLGLLRQHGVAYACLAQASAQFSAFLLIPFCAAFFLNNLHFPRDKLGLLYACGGLAALLTVQALGRLADKRGPVLCICLASFAWLIGCLPWLSLWPLGGHIGELTSGLAGGLALAFILFMAGNAGRNISLSTAISQLARPDQRASLMALQSLVQDIAMTMAAICAAALTSQAQDGSLLGTQALATVSLGAAALACWALWQTVRAHALQLRLA